MSPPGPDRWRHLALSQSFGLTGVRLADSWASWAPCSDTQRSNAEAGIRTQRPIRMIDSTPSLIISSSLVVPMDNFAAAALLFKEQGWAEFCSQGHRQRSRVTPQCDGCPCSWAQRIPGRCLPGVEGHVGRLKFAWPDQY